MTQDRPDAAELLDSLAAFLFSELSDLVPREERFEVLVAANICAVVARELRAGEEPLRADLALFRELLGQESTAEPRRPEGSASEGSANSAELRRSVRSAQAELAAALRAGELDERLDKLAPKLREHVKRKLEVARPGYS